MERDSNNAARFKDLSFGVDGILRRNMGTRADFYVGRGLDAEWLGSVAMDGYAVAEMEAEHADRGDENRAIWAIKTATDEKAFREAVKAYLDFQSHSTYPEQGWPWDDSRTTDFAYAFNDGATYAASFGYVWWNAATESAPDDDSPVKKCVFPDMKERQNVAWGNRSGLMIIQGN
jgi:hypothetical protein